ncbi:MAG: exopolyphosphatase [bacterium]|nr:exopolyphosphatase [bacterium]
MKLASIDVGTNTVRLLIADIDETGNMRDTLVKRVITRLGGGFAGGYLHGESKRRTMTALIDFAKIIAENGICSMRCAATSAIREAVDGQAFIDEIRSETGLLVDVISGEVEASLTLKGVLSQLDRAEKTALVFDIGGGSTEYILAEKGEVNALQSLNMGVVSLTETCLKSDPPSSADISAIKAIVDNFLLTLKREFPSLDMLERRSGSILVGTAGTITTLAALDQKLDIYDSGKINNYRLTRAALNRLFDSLIAKTHKEREAMPGLEEGRADLIIVGTIIVLGTMENFGFDEMVVSDYGLLEGLLLDLAEGKRT